MAQLSPFKKKKDLCASREVLQRRVLLDDCVYNNYDPSAKEIQAYAAWLGMDLEVDKELLWIAKEGLKAPLPAPWKACLADVGTGENLMYYFNVETGKSLWDHPCTEHHKKIYADEKAKAAQHAGGLGMEMPLPFEWESKEDPKSGCQYYFNRLSGVSTWDRPRGNKADRKDQCKKVDFLEEGANKESKKEEECLKTEEGAGELARSLAPALAIPQYWISTDQEILSQGWAVHKVDTGTLATLRRMFQVTQPGELGKGRDVHKYYQAYSGLEVHCAWRIEHQGLWRRFASERVMMAQQLQRAGPKYQEAVETKLSTTASGLPGETNDQVHETWLLHGSRPDVLLTILSNGLNDRVTSGQGGFGAGIYLAEDPEKADQYCSPDPKYASPDLEELHYRLFRPEGNKHPDEDLFYCFAVRALLGATLRTKGLERTGWPEDKSAAVPTRDCQTGEKLFLTDDRRQLVDIPGTVPPVNHHSLVAERGVAVKRFREFVAFDANQVYAEYLLAYKRV
eukprot:gnl/MRDRNA2_/MRDRNA2_92958_c0_seq1.p1 gnl/MRDRNA2_/MRDRNA2_92958_c0~~gnl/MRDRNA2_/MRDRNA2_92958_c0_seq1.p1  ORF type:complete len:560 (+),score=118.68 gnl/MRDRNA2_/MRDRNA2_92958_c0_seq1:151-1680(+)